MVGEVGHRRRSIRLKGYDYSQAGAYFITVCTQGRACLFGDVVGEEMRLNDAGRVVQAIWDALPGHFPFVELDEFVVMPNHVHGVVWIADAERRGVACNAPTNRRNASVSRMAEISPKSGSLAAIIRSFKSAATKRINEWRDAPGAPVWQRNYYEHIIRDEESLDRIRQYIIDNPAQWAMDRENPANTGGGARMLHDDDVGALHATPLRETRHGG
jgi:REP element-mobilizing transposase RayT